MLYQQASKQFLVFLAYENNEQVSIKQKVDYIHNNPVHHRFTENCIECPWTSYGSIVSTKKTKIQREKVIEVFHDLENFKYYHSRFQNLSDIEDLLIE